MRLIVEIIEPYHGRILDPACGSGGMFVQSARFVAEHRKDPAAELSVHGVEKTDEPYIDPCRGGYECNLPKTIKIPPGYFFMMGDNRGESDDSRYWGTVPEQNVIGEPLMIVWSYDAPSRDWLEENPVRQVKFLGSIIANLFTRTRWSRTGVLL